MVGISRIGLLALAGGLALSLGLGAPRPAEARDGCWFAAEEAAYQGILDTLMTPIEPVVGSYGYRRWAWFEGDGRGDVRAYDRPWRFPWSGPARNAHEASAAGVERRVVRIRRSGRFGTGRGILVVRREPRWYDEWRSAAPLLDCAEMPRLRVVTRETG